MATTQNEVIEQSTSTYITGLDLVSPPTPAEIEQELIDLTNAHIRAENTARVNEAVAKSNARDVDANAKNQLPLLKTLTFYQVACLMIALDHVVRIAPSNRNTDRDYDLLAVYNAEGLDEGIYATSEDRIRQMARRYNRSMTINESKEVFTVLREDAPRVQPCNDRDLIAVQNGVFNYKTKKLIPFSPKYIFLAKARVNYRKKPTLPVIIHPEDKTQWDVESWISEVMGDDEELTHLIWEIIGAIVRPHVSWNKSAWFFSTQGNNGKGTLVELMRHVVGPSSYASIPIADFGKDFMLEPLTRANCILVDENDVGTFVDKAANLKAVITNDVIMINRKNKVPISYQFWGFMVQCLNEFPKIKDKSESFYRRQLFVPFDKSFTGAERKYIKDDYIARDDVLEYVLNRVLHMNYYTLSEPQATQIVLAEYKEHNDPVREFWNEMKHQFVWDLLPSNFLYDLYKAWFTKTNPSGSVVSNKGFLQQLEPVVAQSDKWEFNKTKLIRTKRMMDAPETLIHKYELDDWRSSTAPIKDKYRSSVFDNPSASYRGVLRKTPINATLQSVTDGSIFDKILEDTEGAYVDDDATRVEEVDAVNTASTTVTED